MGMGILMLMGKKTKMKNESLRTRFFLSFLDSFSSFSSLLILFLLSCFLAFFLFVVIGWFGLD